MRDISAPADRQRTPQAAAREKRLAEALRDNLSKRKAQQRVRREPPRTEPAPRSSSAMDNDGGSDDGAPGG